MLYASIAVLPQNCTCSVLLSLRSSQCLTMQYQFIHPTSSPPQQTLHEGYSLPNMIRSPPKVRYSSSSQGSKSMALCLNISILVQKSIDSCLSAQVGSPSHKKEPHRTLCTSLSFWPVLTTCTPYLEGSTCILAGHRFRGLWRLACTYGLILSASISFSTRCC